MAIGNTPGRGHALVSGASQGLGLRLATMLAEDGWDVTGFARRPQAEIAGPVPFRYFQADLAEADVVDTVLAELGEPPELVVHCSVQYPLDGEVPPAEQETVFRVNALAPYHLSQALLAKLPEDRFMSVVTVNSEVIFHADHRSALYAASKAALRVLTAGLAEGCRSRNASVATLALGPLADPRKVAELRQIAERKNLTEAEVTRLFLRRSNPDLVIDALLDYELCVRSIRHIHGLGRAANGMVLRLDGGSAGSLV